MQNKVFERGHHRTFTNGSGAKLMSGQLYKIGSLVGVVIGEVEDGAVGVLDLEGVFTVPKAAESIDDGTVLYFDAAAGKVTKTAAAGKPYAGVAWSGALSGDATIQMKILGNAIALPS